jgi:hypothetical protein
MFNITLLTSPLTTFTLTLLDPKEVNAVQISRPVRGYPVQHALDSRDPPLPEIHPMSAWARLPHCRRQAVASSTLDRHGVTCTRPPTPRGHLLAHVSFHASNRHAHSLVTVTSHLPPSWHPMGAMVSLGQHQCRCGIHVNAWYQ